MIKSRKFAAGLLAALCLGTVISASAAASDTDESLIDAGFVFDTPMTPRTYVSCGDVLRTVCRLHAMANGLTLDEDAGYDELLRYAADAGIDTASLGREKTVPKSGDAYTVLYKAINGAACRPIRAWSVPEEWTLDNGTRAALTALVRAGIAEGDILQPTAFLTRGEWDSVLKKAAAAVQRANDLSEDGVRDYGESALLCSTVRLNNPYTHTADSGWRAYFDAATANLSDRDYSVISDISTTKKSRLVRYFNTVCDGKVDLQLRAVINYGFDGLTLSFGDREGTEAAYVLETADGCFYQQTPFGRVCLLDADGATGSYMFEITLDMDKGTAKTVIGGVSCGEHELTGDSFDCMEISTSDATKNIVTVHPSVYVTQNYAANDTFDIHDAIPYGYQTSGSVSLKSLSLTLGKGAKISKSFEAIADKTAFSCSVYLPVSHTGAEIVLKCGTQNIVRLADMFGVLYANGVNLGAYDGRVWQKLRIEADFGEQTADIYLNGKMKATVPFASEVYCADTVSFGNTGTDIRLDDIKVFRVFPTSVPAPVLPEGADECTVGINVCNLWREGEHMGWEEISAYPESYPVLGFYDEGSPESADWELKYMAEHGIDFGAVCWFASESSAPMKSTEYGSHLEEGYFYAEYSDHVKFALLWETANGRIPASSAAFAEYFVPYFTENFFRDERYMTLDGKLFFGIFGASRLIDTFGTDLKTMFDAMRADVKAATGKDMLIIACNTNGRALKQYGFDGFYAYGIDSPTVYSQEYCNRSWGSSSDVPWIPSIGTGYNSAAWNGTYLARMSVSNFTTVCRWVKDEFFAEIGATDGWRKNLVMLGTWNEYGEGSHLMPCDGLHGFDYLDTVRSVFTPGGAHTDVRPDEKQKSRITRNYPQYLKKLAPRGYFNRSENYNTSHIFKSLTSASACDAVLSVERDITRVSVSSGGASYRSTGSDPIFNIKSSVYSGLTCDDISAIQVVASGIPAGDYMQLFFRTDASDAWSEENSIRSVSPSTNETYFVFRVGQHKDWTGGIKAIRFDPCTASGVSFVIKQVNFIKYTAFPALYVNGVKVKTAHLTGVYSPEDKAAHYPFEPAENKLDEYLYLDWDFDFARGVLTLSRDGTTAVFTPGSYNASVNGTSRPIVAPMYLCDGIPMLPVTSLADIFGFTCEKKGDDYYLTTPEKAWYDDQVGTGLSWTFDKIGTLQGFTSEGMTVSYTGTGIEITSVSGDPILYGPSLTDVRCEDYPYIECKVRWNIESTSGRLGVYFITASDSGYSESRYVGQSIGASSNGEWKVIRLPMSSNANWKGTLKRFRFDGFDGKGSMEIAYIKLVA